MIVPTNSQMTILTGNCSPDFVLDFGVSTTALREQFNIHVCAYKRSVIYNPYWIQIKKS